jgi:tRNA A-37 threonylcarbamoyl transferase component Bud32
VTTAERWARAKALFAEASMRPADERDAFVYRACAQDIALRDEVLSLLRAAEGTDSLPIARAAIAAAARAVDVPRSIGAHAGLTERDASLRAALETALGHQYEIVRPLGHGGMGTVYLARERALERFVAIKVLRPELADAQQGRERFRREARVAAQLSHPGILPLHTFGEVGGVWYFVMGYVRGATLAERLRVERRLPRADAQRILAELVDALDCAHRSGVIHRDIKPANILLDADTGRAMLADFGIAKVQDGGDSLTATGMIVGTPSFMSPEQAAGAPDVDARSDLYSLGAVGYLMLSGREPFGISTGEEGGIARRASSTPPDLRTVAPDVPADLALVVMRCLAPDPAHRWPSARVLRDALTLADEETTGGLPVSVRELPAFGPYAVMWAALWLALAASPFRSAGDRALLVLIALLVPVGLVLHVWNVVGGGMSLAQLTRVAFWPPDWWGMWWPRRLRRPSDLWRRLPWRARLVRAALSAFIISLPALILTRRWVEAVTGAGVGWFGLVESVLVIGAGAIVLSVVPWARRRGLTWVETVRLLFGATTSSAGWSAPALRRLLAPARGGARVPEPREPAEYRQSFEAIAAQLDGPARESASRAAETARRVLDLVERCDAELGVLATASGATELDRVAARLAALEGSPTIDEATRELEDLLRAQLAVMRRLQVRCETISSRRARVLQLLHGLWTQLATLRELEPDAERDALARLENVRAELNTEVDAGIDAASDVSVHGV